MTAKTSRGRVPTGGLPGGLSADLTATERLELVLRATNEGLWDWNLITDEVHFSPRWKEMLGYADDELPDRFAEWERRLHPDDGARVWSAIRSYLAGESPAYEVEHRLRHKDGGYRWICARGEAARDADGRPLRLVGSHADITERKRIEHDLLRRDAIFEAVTFAAERFLRMTTTWEERVQEVLARLGRAADVSRVYVFENDVDDDGEQWASQRFEWVAPGISAQIDNPGLIALSYRAAGYGRWLEVFHLGEMMYGHVRDLPDSERPELQKQDIQSIVLVPIFVEGTWWGFIGFDECASERDFSVPEREALKAAADTLGAAIGRDRVDQALKRERDFSSAVLDTVGALVGIFDRQGRIVRFNRACERLSGYTASEVLGRPYWELFLSPDEVDEVRGVMGALAAGQFPNAHENVWVIRDGSRRLIAWNNTAILDEHGEPTFLIGTGIDITERKQAEEELRESQRMLATLLSNLPGMVYRCRNDSDWTMEFVSDGCLDLTGYPPTDLFENVRVAYADLVHPDDRDEVWRAARAAIATDEPFRLTYRLTTAAGAEKWVLEQGRGVHGADGALVAIEGFITDVTNRVQARQQLEQRVEERTRELATLLDVSSTVASTLELDPLLELVLDQLRVVVEYSGAVLYTLDGDELVLVRARISNLDLRDDDVRGARFPTDDSSPLWDLIRRRQPVIIDDVWGESDLARACRDAAGARFETVARNVRSWLAVPLAHKERILGMLTLSSREPGFYTRRHADLATALASQAALAIENARLYEQAQGAAALEERQRLARELHDSVSQALYGIGLGAAAVRSWLETDPTRAIEPTDYVISLAEAGLAEMRALIFELRPESLAEEGIVAALEKQAASLRARHALDVVADLGDEPAVDLEAKEVFYRIAQEALHNTVKHAQASRVELRLAATEAGIELMIADDGRGFEPAADFPGHLGLRSMRERIERLGGTLSIASAPGTGTRIRASLRQP